MAEWTPKQHEEFSVYIDMLTGIFLNEKTSAIRLKAYWYVLREQSPTRVLSILQESIKGAISMPTPAQILSIIEKDHMST